MKTIAYMLSLLLSLLLAGGQAQAPADPSAQTTTAVTAPAVFWNSMGCTDHNCADPTHYHHCAAGCADPAHYHDCPAGCADTTHGHYCPTGNAGTGHHWEGGHHSGHHG